MTTALPIDEHLERIVEAARATNLVIVAEPGAGKTTRVPRALLESGLFGDREIVVLEPRRIAARMAARRVADELGEAIGERVGYAVRFEDQSSSRTRLRFVTEGILTRRLLSEPTLARVGAVVLDEFHERSLHADLALASVRALQRSGARADLRIVVMSATLAAERIAAFLEGPVVQVPGKRFEVAIEHAPGPGGGAPGVRTGPDERPLEVRVSAAVRRAVGARDAGHVLVFLPGAAEIRNAERELASFAASRGIELALLHGDLSPEDQDRAVRPSARRKIILSTNVAETSLTIDGVTAVVDSGLARVARHSPWSGLPALELAPISRASATQRAGRAGRTAAGTAIRLYTKHDHDARPAHDVPEIARADLVEVVLALRARGVREPSSFAFFEAPPSAALSAADRVLELLGAVAADGSLSEIGRALTRLPIHPRLARVALEAEARGVGDRGALLAAILGERDLRLASRARIREHAHRGPSTSGDSDALERLEAFEVVEAQGLSAARLRSHELDVGGGLSVARARDQLRRALARVRLEPRALELSDEDVELRRALMMGFVDRLARRRRPHQPEVLLAGGGAGRLSDQSTVREAQLMVAIEATEVRSGVEVRTASAIEPEWLLESHPELVEDVSEIRFDPAKKRIEKVSGLRVMGLVIDESIGDAAGLPGAARVLARAAIEAGVDQLVDRDALHQLKMRLELARRIDPALPVLDDARIEGVLVEACEGRRSFEELRGAGLLEQIASGLGADVLARLDRAAPTHVVLPGRKRAPVHYEPDRPPWLESRMQDFFGWKEGPKIGGAPVVLHLLAPNHRAVQVTTDLSGFWTRHYPALRRELMRRYPRHAWPEDPTVPLPPRG